MTDRSSAAESSNAGAPMRILVVDDRPDTARISAMLLRAWGYDVEVAHTGREAIERAIAFNPRVILLDIGLPDLSGYEVARQLREDQRTQAAHLVALTGFGQESDFQHSREAGFDLHLVKPVDSAVLQRLLANVQASQPET